MHRRWTRSKRLADKPLHLGFSDSHQNNALYLNCTIPAQPFFETCTVSGALPSAQILRIFRQGERVGQHAQAFAQRNVHLHDPGVLVGAEQIVILRSASSAFFSAFTGLGGGGTMVISVTGKSFLASAPFSASMVFLKASSITF